jgi:2-succinyl-6-hydroxy-2,4-cyclohexadiene-1-carboxylate synthase
MILPHFEVHEGNGPPLLMVHGILSSRAQWLPNLEALKTVATPVVVELFGHGRSPAPADVDCYHPEYYVSVFEDIRRQLGVARWNLLGYSLGAGLTLRYSLLHANRVNVQMFTNSTSAFAEESVTAPIRQNADKILSQYESDGHAAVEAIPVHPRNAKRLPKPVLNALLEDCKLLDPMGVARTIVYTNGYASVRDKIADNIVPTLLLCGEREARFLPHRTYAEEVLAPLKVVALDAGHAVNAEAAEPFNSAVLSFLRDR